MVDLLTSTVMNFLSGVGAFFLTFIFVNCSFHPSKVVQMMTGIEGQSRTKVVVDRVFDAPSKVYFIADNQLFVAEGCITSVNHQAERKASKAWDIEAQPEKHTLEIIGDANVYEMVHADSMHAIMRLHMETNNATPAQILAYARAIYDGNSAEEAT